MAAASLPAAADEWHFEDVDRVVAFSDVHGAFDAMVETLASAGVIDTSRSWSGAGTQLVIVGDILDRGPDSRAAMDLLMRLEEEAADAGGRVHVLMGNHEIMNLIGDMRYVSAAEYAAFAEDEPSEQRDYWFDAFRSLRGLPEQAEEESRAEFDRRFPAGYFAHRNAFSPDGKYGKWLLSKPMIVVIDGTAFVHGGLSPVVADIGLEGINSDLVGDVALYARQLSLLMDEKILLPTDANRDHVSLLERFDPANNEDEQIRQAVADIRRLNDPLYSYQSPHWYRGHTYCSELIESDRLNASLKRIGAERVAVGHTPTPTRQITERLDGRVIEIDTGMLKRYYKGSGNALVIEDGQLSIIHQDGSTAAGPVESARRVGSRPGENLTAEQIEDLLRTGEISAGDDDGLLSVSSGDQAIEARFIRRSRADNYPEVAAYRLDRLLKLDMVPVAVVREYGDKKGTLQFMPDDTMDERQRQEERVGGGAWCPLPEQWPSMMIFDALVANDVRSAETILYNLDTWQLLLIGHEGAFTLSTTKSARFLDGEVKIGSAWQKAMRGLDGDRLQAELGDVLDKRRIRALAKRRDQLLSQ